MSQIVGEKRRKWHAGLGGPEEEFCEGEARRVRNKTDEETQIFYWAIFLERHVIMCTESHVR